MRQQAVQPIVLQLDVGVDECDEGCGHLGETGVARRAGPGIALQTDPVLPRPRRQRRFAGVVDDDHLAGSAD